MPNIANPGEGHMSTKKKTFSYHYLSKEDEALIYELVDSTLKEAPGDSNQTRKDKENRRREFEAFKKQWSTDRPTEKWMKRLCYESLPELLTISGLSYLDFLKHLSKDPDGNPFDIKWSSETEAKMCSYCDLLSPDHKEKVLAMIRRILPPAFENSDFESMTPMNRLAQASFLRSYCIGETKKQSKELGVIDIYMQRFLPYSYSLMELSLISYMAFHFDVSPHWLLGLDESQTVLAANGNTEKIMDLFCFLPDERKQMICQAVQTAIERGGAV